MSVESDQERLDKELWGVIVKLSLCKERSEETRELRALSELLRQGADPNAMEERWGIRPLHFVAQGRSIKTAKMLVEAGADVNAEDHSGVGPLRASMRGISNNKMLYWLLEAGANPSPGPGRGRGRPLNLAASRCDKEVCLALIKAGARGEPNARGETPLHQAASEGSSSLLRLLLREGECDLDARDENGLTAAQRAAGERPNYEGEKFLTSREARKIYSERQARELEAATSETGPRAAKAKARL